MLISHLWITYFLCTMFLLAQVTSVVTYHFTWRIFASGFHVITTWSGSTPSLLSYKSYFIWQVCHLLKGYWNDDITCLPATQYHNWNITVPFTINWAHLKLHQKCIHYNNVPCMALSGRKTGIHYHFENPLLPKWSFWSIYIWILLPAGSLLFGFGENLVLFKPFGKGLAKKVCQ